MTVVEHNLVIPSEMATYRLDKALSELLPQYSRAKLSEWLKSSQALVNGAKLQPKYKVLGGENVIIAATIQASDEHLAEAIPLDIVYEDEHLLVLNKPTNMVVHPAAGHHNGTLLNGLLHHCPALAKLPRAGIVHRLDKDTTGLMVVAKSLESHHGLVKMLQERDIQRHYYAIVQGYMIAGGTIRTFFGRHTNNRLKMAVLPEGKEAVTHYKVAKRFKNHSLVDVKLDTGRTHQIRVHMNHIKYSIVGDALYSGRGKLPKGCAPELRDLLMNFPRQALHAYRLSFVHPITKETISTDAPMPADMCELLDAISESEQLS